MKTYSLFDAPLRVFGVPFFEQKRKLERVPDEIVALVPGVAPVAKNCPGGSVAFKTDAAEFTVRVTLNSMNLDVGQSIYSAQSCQVLVGERPNARNLGVVNPRNYEALTYEKTIKKSADLEQVTILFPRFDRLENIEVILDDDAQVSEPTPYRYQKPVVFYGSSIVEGGCSGNNNTAYNAILSNWFDFDYYNFGFSGRAKGELAMADYIATIDMGAFVYDYDHNAPTVEHLAATHKPFFDRIREVHPDIPILLMSRPAECYTEKMVQRRRIVKDTYDAAIAAGDKNVYFIDGETLYGETDRNLCSSDNVHPNDLGFYRMASTIRPVMEQMLKNME